LSGGIFTKEYENLYFEWKFDLEQEHILGNYTIYGEGDPTAVSGWAFVSRSDQDQAVELFEGKQFKSYKMNGFFGSE